MSIAASVYMQMIPPCISVALLQTRPPDLFFFFKDSLGHFYPYCRLHDIEVTDRKH